MARTSPVSLVVISLILVVIFLAVDLHSKSQTLIQQNSSPPTLVTKPILLVDEQPDDVVIYNRIPKTASTAFTHVVYDLCKGTQRKISYRQLRLQLEMYCKKIYKFNSS